jgi:hypothetical protein
MGHLVGGLPRHLERGDLLFHLGMEENRHVRIKRTIARLCPAAGLRV